MAVAAMALSIGKRTWKTRRAAHPTHSRHVPIFARRIPRAIGSTNATLSKSRCAARAGVRYNPRQSGDVNALPILQQILEGHQSERLKERALFVLAQDQSKPAQDLLQQIIRGEKDPNLQVRGIRLLATAKGRAAGDALADVYGRSTNLSVKKAVLESYLI